MVLIATIAVVALAVAGVAVVEEVAVERRLLEREVRRLAGAKRQGAVFAAQRDRLCDRRGVAAREQARADPPFIIERRAVIDPVRRESDRAREYAVPCGTQRLITSIGRVRVGCARDVRLDRHPRRDRAADEVAVDLATGGRREQIRRRHRVGAQLIRRESIRRESIRRESIRRESICRESIRRQAILRSDVLRRRALRRIRIETRRQRNGGQCDQDCAHWNQDALVIRSIASFSSKTTSILDERYAAAYWRSCATHIPLASGYGAQLSTSRAGPSITLPQIEARVVPSATLAPARPSSSSRDVMTATSSLVATAIRPRATWSRSSCHLPSRSRRRAQLGRATFDVERDHVAFGAGDGGLDHRAQRVDQLAARRSVRRARGRAHARSARRSAGSISVLVDGRGRAP